MVTSIGAVYVPDRVAAVMQYQTVAVPVKFVGAATVQLLFVHGPVMDQSPAVTVALDVCQRVPRAATTAKAARSAITHAIFLPPTV
jgi:hypothetical protein